MQLMPCWPSHWQWLSCLNWKWKGKENILWNDSKIFPYLNQTQTSRAWLRMYRSSDADLQWASSTGTGAAWITVIHWKPFQHRAAAASSNPCFLALISPSHQQFYEYELNVHQIYLNNLNDLENQFVNFQSHLCPISWHTWYFLVA